jgi:hypothetical protein
MLFAPYANANYKHAGSYGTDDGSSEGEMLQVVSQSGSANNAREAADVE